MDVLEIPFNKFVGLKKVCSSDGFIFKLEYKNDYLNHIGTVHASALFALAEASGGEFLLNQFKDQNLNIFPVVRKVEVKYSKPATGEVFSKASLMDSSVDKIIDELTSKKRVLVKIKVDIYDKSGTKIFNSVFDWFLSLI